MNMKFNQSAGTWVVAVIAILFGLLTIKSGGLTLFVDGADREAAGNYVPFVLWFNFMAGFVYLVAGVGLFMNKQWAAWLSIGIVSATAIVFIFFGLHIFNDGLYENRTVVAMSLRTIIWAMIAIFSYRRIIRQ
ncbi:MAG: hypothetical protein KAT90_15040 [Gammaproteobacteria bacterium]|nr:hypothetical protein [Gammaproteobacteria bacterium]